MPFLSAELGLQIELRRDHALYIQSWLAVLQNDQRATFAATTKAQQAVDWLFQRDLQGQEAAA